MAQHRAQGAGESHPDLGFDLDLRDAGDLVLDRVFDRHELDLRVHQMAQACIERRRLAAAGRAGDQRDAVRLGKRRDQALPGMIGETESRHVEVGGCLVEQAQGNGLAMQAGHRGDAQVDIAAPNGGSDTAVLRESAFGNVQLGEDLDARDDRLGRAFDRQVDRRHRAVEAHADANVVALRLNMNV